MRKASGLQKYLGMMFRTSDTEPIYWDFEKDVDIKFHTLFCFFPICGIWKDSNDNVICTKTLKPWKLGHHPGKPFRKFIEIPIKKI